MNKVDVHRAWARPEGRWSPWVKPLLFAALADDIELEPLDPPPSWLGTSVIEPLAAAGTRGAPYRRAGDPLADVAMVVDLPGAEGALLGVALAKHGFFPVPLYNGLWGKQAVIDVEPIMLALADGAETVREAPGTGPPAFLLDADRFGRGRAIHTGDFDNRWFSMPTDFPSADALWAAGLRRVALIQRGDPWPRPDLAPTLLAFQRRGLQLLLVSAGSRPVPLASVRTPWLVRIGYFFERGAFERRADGAFGRRMVG